MMATNAGLLLIASCPLLLDRDKGPVNGTMLLGRFLSGSLYDRVQERTQVAFLFQPIVPGDPLPAGLGPWIHVRGPVLEASTLLRDFQGSPIARLTVERPTDIMKHGRATILWSFAPLLGGLAIVLVALASLMSSTILVPLDRLSRMVVSIRTTGTFVARLGLRRRDEIGTLAENFDAMLDQLAEKSAMLEQLATTDPLMGILNRRAIMEAVAREASRAGRYRLPLAVLMTDIDHFKTVNDTYGHAAGDEVLAGVAHRLAATVRDSDFAGRYGGEEFLVVLPHQDAHGAVLAAERIRAGIAETPMGTRNLQVTVSIGVGVLAEGRMEEMLARADQALYEAKRKGRNRTIAG
jgi:diguanylate cyclase (GGDEF)-like protein